MQTVPVHHYFGVANSMYHLYAGSGFFQPETFAVDNCLITQRVKIGKAFAEFYLKTDPVPGKIVVPVESLIEEQNTFYVYLQVSGETYLKKQVRIDASDGIYAEVRSGLKPGDRVVTRGAMILKASSVSSAPVHSHAH